MKTQHIIPAIIPDSLLYLQSRLKEVRGFVRRVQIDVMDGTYVPVTTWPYDNSSREAFESKKKEGEGIPYWQDFDFEIDLMVENPENKILDWALVGARCVIVHVESTKNVSEVIDKCYENRLEVALALKPSTDISVLSENINRVLFVQVMGSDRIGHNGVSLDERVLDKIREIKNKWTETVVGVDIGVNEETIPSLCEAGATRFASGSAVFNYASPVGAISNLENIVSKNIKDK